MDMIQELKERRRNLQEQYDRIGLELQVVKGMLKEQLMDELKDKFWSRLKETADHKILGFPLTFEVRWKDGARLYQLDQYAWAPWVWSANPACVVGLPLRLKSKQRNEYRPLKTGKYINANMALHHSFYREVNVVEK